MIHALALTLGLLLLATSGTAQEPRGIDGVEEVFVRWMKEHNVTRGSFALAYDDRLVLAKGYGGLTPDTRVLIASLSKVITGVCVATLIQDGKLRLDTPIGALLDRVQPALPAPRDARLRKVTVEQLLTHRSGFGRAGGDPVTGLTFGRVVAKRGIQQATMHDLLPGMLDAKLDHDPGTKYAYTNASHLLLGVAIEVVTGETYEDYCGAAVLRPQGVQRPTLHGRWGVLGPFGGWNLTGAEYLAFLRVFAPTSTALSPEIRAWMLNPSGKEMSRTSPDWYSLLVVHPVTRKSHDFAHSGSWGFRLNKTDEGIGTRAVRTASGVSWFVSFEPRPPVGARAALDRQLHHAASIVTTWPETDLYASLGVRANGGE